MVPGAYATERVIDAKHLVKLPAAIDDRHAASIMLKGLTAWYLVRRTHRVAAGDRVLVHAAAGGVGLILCQWAAALGAEVIGTVGSEEKADLARRHGCRHVVRYDREPFVARVREITGGRGVHVVYDSVGRTTFMGSLDCLVPRGLLVSFGQSAGPVPPLDVGVLAQKGSLFLTRPTLANYIAERDELVRGAEELFEQVARGTIRVAIGQTYPLVETERAHRDLEGRRTSGSTVLLP
jgi:NADPH2:quinone reductase